MDNNQIFETVKLPNGGTVQLDKLAFETFQGQCISSHKINGKYVWKVTLDFESANYVSDYTLDFDGNDIETAALQKTKMELR